MIPCIGCNSGGPLETLACDGCKLCPPRKEAFAEAMREVFDDADRADALRAHVKKFGFDHFAKQWIELCDRVK